MSPRETLVRSRRALALGLVALPALVACGGAQRRVAPAEPTPSAVASAPSAAPEAPPAPPPLRLVEQRNERDPLVTVRVVFEAGSADDPAGKEGLTTVLARAMTEGGTRELTYEQLTRRLFPMAARVEALVERDTTAFVAQVHRDHLEAFYPLLRDMLLAPRLDDDDVRRVRAQTLAALTQELRGNDDEALAKEALHAELYRGHPYGHPPLGTEGGLEAVTRADVEAHRARVFCAERALVGLAGGYPEGLAARVREDFAALPHGSCARAPLPEPPARPDGLTVTIIDKPAAGAVAVSLGQPLPITRAHEDFAALQFTTHYLGLHRQSSGVLYNALREVRGLNYGAYAYAEWFEQEGSGRFPRTNIARRQQLASLWLRPVRPNTAHFALRAAVRAVDEALAHGIPPASFARTQAFLDGYLSLYAQTASARLGYALDDLALGRSGPGYLERMRGAWAQLAGEPTLAVARRYLATRSMHVVLVAPNARELAAALVADAPSPITYDSRRAPNVLAEDRVIEAYPLRLTAERVRVVPLGETFR